MIKKAGVLCGALLMGTLLGACGNRQAQSNRNSQEYSSLKKKNSQLKKQASDSTSSSLSASSSTTSTNAQQSNDQKLIDSTQTSNGQTVTVSNQDQAIAIVRAKYGDNNGEWHWECLSGGDDDGYYFVKAISKSAIANGSMTGTAKSVKVYHDGSIDEV